MPRTPVLAAALLALALFPACSKQSEAAGRNGTALGLGDVKDQTITQGSTNDVGISIDRKNFADAVQISFDNLPAGVRVEGKEIPAGESRKDFRLVAAPDAALVTNHLVTVSARGSGAALTDTFQLTVKAK
jgi:hypothetical protein